ncbi:MAG: hypothetical protein ACKVG9_13930, partial [Rhodospirillales bacterium]
VDNTKALKKNALICTKKVSIPYENRSPPLVAGFEDEKPQSHILSSFLHGAATHCCRGYAKRATRRYTAVRPAVGSEGAVR